MAGDDAETWVVRAQFRLAGAAGLTAQAAGSFGEADRRPQLAQQMFHVQQLMMAANSAPRRQARRRFQQLPQADVSLTRIFAH